MALLDMTASTILGDVSPLWTIPALGIIYLTSYIIYNLFFHPLASYPGPKLYAATQIPYTYAFNAGTLPYKAHYYHELYKSDVVRLAPNKLSYINPDAYKEIKGHRKLNQDENGKDPDFFYFVRSSIIAAPRDAHSKVRKALSHGFSARTMQEQSGIILGYVDLFISRLKEIVQKESQQHGNEKHTSGNVNLVEWFNHFTFDIIGDLAFGTPFGSLETGKTHPWVKIVFESVQRFAKMVTVRWYAPWLTKFVVMTGVGKPQQQQAIFAAEKVKERLEITTSRPDFVDSLVRENSDGQAIFSETEIVQTMRLIVLAGSETTATALSGAAYFLCKHPEIQRKLTEEIRAAFIEESEIDMVSVNKLRYMLAVLDETLRIYPPAANSFPRQCQKGGDIIMGKHVPGGTTLDTFHWAMTHSTKYFTDPEEFIPERWLADNPRFPNDTLEASQPFSVGPRNCIGKKYVMPSPDGAMKMLEDTDYLVTIPSLAYVEMRVIVARLLWNFDLEFADPVKAEKWLDQRVFNLWLKPDLDYKLTFVRRD
ncbi:hypothetical protein V8F20_010828 [Naviculisporaceae sp. PSN 640]